LKRRLFALLALTAACARAQDPFEIHVYEYETLSPLRFTLEQHLNYWAMGSKEFDGSVAPTNDQLHMTYELTGGITNQISLGVMQLNGVIPGTGFEYAGWRVLPHFYAPKSWHLPLDLGLVAEFSFVRPQFLADTRHVEIRPILERIVGAFQLDFTRCSRTRYTGRASATDGLSNRRRGWPPVRRTSASGRIWSGTAKSIRCRSINSFREWT